MLNFFEKHAQLIQYITGGIGAIATAISTIAGIKDGKNTTENTIRETTIKYLEEHKGE